MQTLKVTNIDATCSHLEQLEEEAKAIRAELLEQVLEHGFIPHRAEKSKRLCGELYQPELFKQLFRSDVITRWRLVDGATMLLAGVLPEGAPHNLRMMFNRALTVKENANFSREH
jgi:hypothetical protein